MAKYGISKVLDCGYDEAVEKTREALMGEGFGVMTEIDVKAALKQKLDKDFRRYIILGACNPQYAHKALTAELPVGLLLPCNVIVYDNEDGTSTVTAIDPVRAMEIVDNPELRQIAEEVKGKLTDVIGALG